MRFTLLLLVAVGATAQVPDKFTNLQVLPKDIAKPELMNIMRGFSFSLGARCVDCHVGKDSPSLEGVDFKADDKETKKTAREMLRMVAAINKDYVGKLPSASAARVECVTCHHGLRKPRTLQAALGEELEKKDLAAAIALYHDLRKQYYGGDQYDFTETSLNLLVESLGRQHKIKEAAAFMELNAENTTLTRWGRSLIAMAHKANGETEKAIADFQKIVDANPGDAWAKQQLEELKTAKK
jgi:tetratricopeptide (TPR) repeat protein